MIFKNDPSKSAEIEKKFDALVIELGLDQPEEVRKTRKIQQILSRHNHLYADAE